ncbi:hypothetical protein LPTSP4_02600 [Leptospira ryugenii]|uniref:Alginate export domain-containing protein n=1 Tax=Leptospira ryugenii TaxID=1917863 RepID=A0A2P2DW22_9LEPT|nr:hypothetical protein [Leptospira ryugenii]GBF48760.1 hypothetical protein LPTSP4_02600 [Leptospira ryugenii]
MIHSIFLFFIAVVSLFPESKHQVSFKPFYIQDSLRLEEKENRQTPVHWSIDEGLDIQNGNRFLQKQSTGKIQLGYQYKNSSDWLRMDLSASFVSVSQTTAPILFLGKNAYSGIQILGFTIGIGRREFLFRQSPFIGYVDGGEGAFLESDQNSRFKIQLFLFDLYRSFPLFEKFIFAYPSDLLTGELNVAQRRRHSIGIVYESPLKLSLGLSYIELGTLGKHTKEIRSYQTKYGADGDSFLHGNLGICWQRKGLYLQAEVLLSKGYDRANPQTTGNIGSFPIEGEAVQLGIGNQEGWIQVRQSIHLSDQDQRDESQKIQKLSYIGTGSHLGESPILSQTFRIFPSLQLTEDGLLRSQSISGGRFPASYSESEITFFIFDWKLRLLQSFLLPYRNLPGSDGKISLKKENYESFLFSESSLFFSFLREGGELGFLFSHLQTPKHIGLEADLLALYGMVQF